MGKKMSFRAVEADQCLARVVAVVMASNFWRFGWRADIKLSPSGDRWADIALDAMRFSGQFRIKPWLLVPTLERRAARRQAALRCGVPDGPPESQAAPSDRIPLTIALPESLDWAVLFDGRLAEEAAVEPASYVRSVPLTLIQATGWHTWEADHADENGPVMSLLGVATHRLSMLPVYEQEATGLDTPYRTLLARGFLTSAGRASFWASMDA